MTKDYVINRTICVTGKIGSGKTLLSSFEIQRRVEIAHNKLNNRLMDIQSKHPEFKFRLFESWLILLYMKWYKKQLNEKYGRIKHKMLDWFIPTEEAKEKSLLSFKANLSVVSGELKMDLKKAFEVAYKYYCPVKEDYVLVPTGQVNSKGKDEFEKRKIKYEDYQRFYNIDDFNKIDFEKYEKTFLKKYKKPKKQLDELDSLFDSKKISEKEYNQKRVEAIINNTTIDEAYIYAYDKLCENELKEVIDYYMANIELKMSKIDEEINVKIKDIKNGTGIDVIELEKSSNDGDLEKLNQLANDFDFYDLYTDILNQQSKNGAIKELWLIEYAYNYYMRYLRGNMIISNVPIFNKKTGEKSVILDSEWFYVSRKKTVIEPYMFILFDEASYQFHSYDSKDHIVNAGVVLCIQTFRHLTYGESMFIAITQTMTSLHKQLRDNMETFIYLIERSKRKVATMFYSLIYKFNDKIKIFYGRRIRSHISKKIKVPDTSNSNNYVRLKNNVDMLLYIMLRMYSLHLKIQNRIEKKYMYFVISAKISYDADLSKENTIKTKIKIPAIEIYDTYYSMFYTYYYFEELRKNKNRIAINDRYSSLAPTLDELSKNHIAWQDSLFDLGIEEPKHK